MTADGTARFWLLSAATHAVLAGVLVAVLAGPAGQPPPSRIEAAWEIPVALEEGPPPLEPEAPPDPGTAAAVVDLASALPDPEPEWTDPRLAAEPGGAAARAPSTVGEPGVLGLGGGGPRGGPRRAAAARAGDGDGGAAPPPAPPGPTTRARPLPGASAPPEFPARERRLGLSGVVLLRVHVAADGSVAAVEIEESSGSRALDAAAVEAVLAWRFEPALVDGVPAPDAVLVPVRFAILTGSG